MSTAGSPSELHPLNAAQARTVYARYRDAAAFFPLIGAVLEGSQAGAVLADDPTCPQQVYVEHSFGFAQVLGTPIPPFESALQRYLLVDRAFAAVKVRLYTPLLPDFLATDATSPLRSERQRFILPRNTMPEPVQGSLHLAARPVDASNFDLIEAAFGVGSRFWPSAEEFIRCSRATVATLEGKPASLCYAAAVSGARAEIDVLTLPAFRHKGAGRFAVSQFVQRCRRDGIEPMWDCFTNNLGSMELCRSAGFRPAADPYPFFTIPK